jgi:hypothetical protein
LQVLRFIFAAVPQSARLPGERQRQDPVAERVLATKTRLPRANSTDDLCGGRRDESVT